MGMEAVGGEGCHCPSGQADLPDAVLRVQEMQGRADAFDVFIGAGLLDSRVDAGQRLHRHLAAFAAGTDASNTALPLPLLVQFVFRSRRGLSTGSAYC